MRTSAPIVEQNDPSDSLLINLWHDIDKVVSGYNNRVLKSASDSSTRAAQQLAQILNENRAYEASDVDTFINSTIQLLQRITLFRDEVNNSGRKSQLFNDLRELWQVGLVTVARNQAFLTHFLNTNQDIINCIAYQEDKISQSPLQTVGDMLLIAATEAHHIPNIALLIAKGAFPSKACQRLRENPEPLLSDALTRANEECPKKEDHLSAKEREKKEAYALFVELHTEINANREALSKKDITIAEALRFTLRDAALARLEISDYGTLFNKTRLAQAEETPPARRALEKIELLSSELRDPAPRKTQKQTKQAQASHKEEEVVQSVSIKDLVTHRLETMKALEAVDTLNRELTQDPTNEETRLALKAALENRLLGQVKDWETLFNGQALRNARRDRVLQTLKGEVKLNGTRTKGTVENWAVSHRFDSSVIAKTEQVLAKAPLFISEESLQKPGILPQIVRALQKMIPSDLEKFKTALDQVKSTASLIHLLNHPLDSGVSLLENAPQDFIAYFVKKALSLTSVESLTPETRDSLLKPLIEQHVFGLNAKGRELSARTDGAITAMLDDFGPEMLNVDKMGNDFPCTTLILTAAAQRGKETKDYDFMYNVIDDIVDNVFANKLAILPINNYKAAVAIAKNALNTTEEPKLYGYLLYRLIVEQQGRIGKQRQSINSLALSINSSEGESGPTFSPVVALLTAITNTVESDLQKTVEERRSVLYSVINAIHSREEQASPLLGMAIRDRNLDLMKILLSHGLDLTQTHDGKPENAAWVVILANMGKVPQGEREKAQKFALGVLKAVSARRELPLDGISLKPASFPELQVKEALSVVEGIKNQWSLTGDDYKELLLHTVEGNLRKTMNHHSIEAFDAVYDPTKDQVSVKDENGQSFALELANKIFTDATESGTIPDLLAFAAHAYFHINHKLSDEDKGTIKTKLEQARNHVDSEEQRQINDILTTIDNADAQHDQSDQSDQSDQTEDNASMAGNPYRFLKGSSGGDHGEGKAAAESEDIPLRTNSF